MLSVEELRQRKHQLELAIAELIQVFERETCVEVEDLLTLERRFDARNATDTHAAYIKVETQLNM